MSRSSANPFKLSSYSTSGLELSTTLDTKATALRSALDGLRGSSSVYVPALGEADATMVDLAADWFHLDEFCGDVANGFFQANQSLLDFPLRPGQMDTMVLTLGDDTIFRLGQVGYADRDEAIDAANQMAAELERIQEEGWSREEIEAFLGSAGRGQYDPAFSVTFVERVGVQGLVDVASYVTGLADPDHLREQPQWGLDQLAPFAMIMTTALDTRAGIPNTDLHDLSNQGLPDGERISEDFVRSLTTDWVPEDSFDGEFHLSVLMSQVDPPTDVAVELANNRMSPRLLYNHEPTGPSSVWGGGSGVVSNYARMLERNDDASAQWLAHEGPGGETNMELSLSVGHDFFFDTGEAIAGVVENGVTHIDSDLRRELMNEAIDVIGGDMDEIRNYHMEAALAAGVERNMDVIADRVTQVGGGPLGDSQGQADLLLNTHDFIRELMGSEDPSIGARVYSATLEFVHDELHQAGPGESLGQETTEIGAVTSLVVEADINAEVGDAEERAARRQAFLDGIGRVADSTIGLIPGGSALAKGSRSALGWGADTLLGLAEDNDSVEEALANGTDYRTAAQDMIALALANHEYATGDLTATQAMDAAQDAGANGDTDFFVDGTTGDKRPIKPLEEMSEEERDAYLRWVNSEQVEDLITGERTDAGQAADNIQERVEGRT